MPALEAGSAAARRRSWSATAPARRRCSPPTASHRCADVVLRLTATAAGAPGFVHLPAADAVTAAGLSEREADVLVLLLRGLTTAAIGARLCVAPSTARTHCRAVLRKLGAGDRRALRALLLAGPRAGLRRRRSRGLSSRRRQLCRGIGRGGAPPARPYLRQGRGPAVLQTVRDRSRAPERGGSA